MPQQAASEPNTAPRPSGNQRQATISKCDTDYHQGGSAHSALKDPLSNAHHVEAAPLPARATVSRRRLVCLSGGFGSALPIAPGQRPHRPTLRCCALLLLLSGGLDNVPPIFVEGRQPRSPPLRALLRPLQPAGARQRFSCHRFSVSAPSEK